MLRRKSKSVIYLSVAASIVLLQGCSFTTFLGGAETSKPIYVLNVPPNRIGYGGTMSKEDRELLLEMAGMMLDKPYKEFHYPYSAGVKVENSSKSNLSHSYSGTTAIQAKGRIK